MTINIDWSDLGKTVGPILANNAPTIGGILGGLIPIPGGSLIGQEAGQLLANAFGTQNDPTAIANAIQNDPNAAAKITAAETEATAKWPALAQMAQAIAQANSTEAESINATMRQELAAGQKWYAWRNVYGYSVGLETSTFSLILAYGIVFSPPVMQNIQASFSFLITWYTLRFGLLGYIHNQATQEKIAAATGQVPDTIVKSMIKAVKGK